MNQYFPISPLDGRYHSTTCSLSDFFSDYALVKTRCIVELEYLKALDKTRLFGKLSRRRITKINNFIKSFNEKDYKSILHIEAQIHHDVKACELYLKEQLNLKYPDLLHFAITSEDINNISYSLLLSDFVNKQQLPILKSIINLITKNVIQYKNIPLVARTHGQKAVVTTIGKELAVYLNRLIEQYTKLNNFVFKSKFNGAVGTFAAHVSAFPEYDWIEFSNNFIKSFGLEPNIYTTQIEDHDRWGEYFFITKQIANILIDLDRDMWLYISNDIFKEKTHKIEVGSSTMPHKINPIRFENSEGNLELASNLLGFLIDKLSHSRLQRDLSESTVERNIGVALSHFYIGVTQSIKGLKRIKPNKEFCYKELENSPELLMEQLQTILRATNNTDSYEKIKQFSRGKNITFESIKHFINSLKDLSTETKDRLKGQTFNIGLCLELCDMVITKKEKDIGV